MTATRSQISIRPGQLLGAGLLSWALSTVAATALGAPATADDTYLDGLQGRWIMQGTYAGRPVTYDASGEKVLGRTWLKLHMIDAATPPQYVADVFLGYDTKAHDFIVHRLDQFGAGGARVVATGHRDGDRLVFTFPYAEGAFRDTLQRDEPNGAWMLLMESQRKQGTWSTVANFKLTRPPER